MEEDRQHVSDTPSSSMQLVAASCLWTIASLSGCDVVTGTRPAPDCLARKCCEGVWSLECPTDVVDPEYEGRTSELDELSCPSEVECWLEVRRPENMPNAAVWSPSDWSPPRVVTESGREITLSAQPCEITHPNVFRTCAGVSCPAGACHDMEGFEGW
jgi:hypothetical protein